MTFEMSSGETSTLFEVAADISGAHPARVQGDHGVVEAVETALVLLDDDRLERAIAISGNLDFEFAVARLDPFCRRPVARVAANLGAPLALLVAEVRGHLALQRAFEEPLGELINQPSVS